jgi:hypothetical protein
MVRQLNSVNSSEALKDPALVHLDEWGETSSDIVIWSPLHDLDYDHAQLLLWAPPATGPQLRLSGRPPRRADGRYLWFPLMGPRDAIVLSVRRGFHGLFALPFFSTHRTRSVVDVRLSCGGVAGSSGGARWKKRGTH